MTWTNNFFLILTLTVTASCFLGLWSLGEKKWEKDGWTALASYLLYGVVLLHLVPVVSIPGDSEPPFRRHCTAVPF